MQKHSFVIAFVLLCLPGCLGFKRTQKKETVTFSSKTPQFASQKAIVRNTLFSEEDTEDLSWEEQEEGNHFLSQTTTSENSAVVIRSAEDGKHHEAAAFKTIAFDYDQYTLRPDQMVALEESLRMIKRIVRRGKSVLIEGHACMSAGSGEYNFMLSERRAEAVAKYLIEHGVPAESLKIVGRGNEMPLVADVRDMISQAPNRRVEFYVL